MNIHTSDKERSHKQSWSQLIRLQREREVEGETDSPVQNHHARVCQTLVAYEKRNHDKVNHGKLIWVLAAAELLIIMALHHRIKITIPNVSTGAKVWPCAAVCRSHTVHVVPPKAVGSQSHFSPSLCRATATKEQGGNSRPSKQKKDCFMFILTSETFSHYSSHQNLSPTLLRPSHCC